MMGKSTALDILRENLKGYVEPETINHLVRNERLFRQLQHLDIQTIFEALTCLTDSGYKLTKKEKSTITRLITIQRMIVDGET